MQDAIQRKRLNPARGEKSGKCKLRDNDVLIILQRHLNGEKQKDIAKDYSVTPKQISMIVRGKQWSHMQQPQWVLKLH
jgi:Mor family transcriptional regulator